jgi:hypothetical protein
MRTIKMPSEQLKVPEMVIDLDKEDESSSPLARSVIGQSWRMNMKAGEVVGAHRWPYDHAHPAAA